MPLGTSFTIAARRSVWPCVLYLRHGLMRNATQLSNWIQRQSIHPRSRRAGSWTLQEKFRRGNLIVRHLPNHRVRQLSIMEVNSVGMRNPFTENITSDDIESVVRLGPEQPRGVAFKVTNVLAGDRLKALKFQETWYDRRPWLEYSTVEDKACCFYCRLFQPKTNG